MSDQARTPRRVAPADGRDPAVTVPAAVRKAAERAEALAKGENPEAPPVEQQPEQRPEETGITLVPPATAQPRQQMPVEPPVQQPPATPADPHEKKYSQNDLDSMKARFEQAQRNNVRMSEEINNLRNVIATMQTAPAPAPAQTPPELQAQSLLTPQEIADYGPEFLDVVGKKAREIAGAEIADLKKQIDQLTNGMRATSQVTMEQARDRMLAHLDEKLPEWRNLNTDPKFLEWLALPDAFSGAIRQTLLTQAYEQNNAPRVQAFFQGFLAEEAAVAPANVPPAQQPSATPPSRVPLETFAAPGRAKSAAASAPAEKPIITRAQVAAFYADVAAGKYRGREAEKDANEAAIFLATNEGRLR